MKPFLDMRNMKDMKTQRKAGNGVAQTRAFPNGVWERGGRLN